MNETLERAAAVSGWRRTLLPGVCLAVLAIALTWSQRLTHDHDASLGQQLTRADTWVPTADHPADTAPPETANWQPTPLPDNWKLARPDMPAGSVWYRLRFETQDMAAPAILVPRLAASGQVLLNGSRLWDSRSRDPGVTRSWNAPLLLRLPDGLMHASGNVLLVEVVGEPRFRAGLSAIQLAPFEALLPRFTWRQFWQHDGAMLSCSLALLAGALMLLTWLGHRGNTMLLYFGLATVAWTARNSNLFLGELPITINAWAAMLQGGHAWFGTLFGLFVLRFTDTRWRGFEWMLWAYALVNTGLMFSGQLTRVEPVVRLLAIPGAALYAVLVGLLLRKGWRDRSIESALVAATTITFVMLSLRDGLLLDSRLPYEAYFISHYTGLLMLVAIVCSMVTRLATARGAVERLNVELEQRVAQRTLELANANAAKTRFLAAASHDLRQPAVAIGLMIGLVRERVLAPEVRQMIDRAHQAVGALESLLQGLLDLSRLDSGTVQPRITTLPLQAVFDAIQSHEAETAAAKGLRLRFRAHGLAVQCDALLLDQLLRNLVANALRYTERGGVLVVARARGRDQVLIQVWDSGVGIAPQHQAEVFDEFVQVGNPGRDSAHGLGLGLALVKRCATLLGTRVQLRSAPGRGSCFGVLLPRQERRTAPRTVAAAPSLAPLSGRRLLVVDDDAAVREALTARLEAWGAQVSAFDGLQGVSDWLAAGHARPDMLLTDQQLTAGSGLQVIEALHARFGAVPTLLVTGNTAPAEIARLVASGLPVLHKPFRAEALLAAIEKATGRA